ncbi:hypothetical protein J8281_13680 [Aquimarina sp. U1-2]|uniref:hypothetical protein n=1 Tax=Aquimarina sp. U1-2 TaxID=2823141 RepID=UPI001AECBB7B|nr:hypothetical protein [Aquimarina sp. U1-2]MBP2833239.1 hypothetical protein [Aquimarina sp. U1-2]
MKNLNINTILQIIALLFLIIIGYMSFSSGSKWEIIQQQLNTAQQELKTSKETLQTTKIALENSREEFKKMRLQKDLMIHKRDSLIFDFKKKNAKDWEELQRIKDSIKFTNDKLAEDKALINSLFGIKE